MRVSILAVFAAAALAPAVAAFAATPEGPAPKPPGTFVMKPLPEANVVEFDVLAVSVPSRMPNYCAVSAIVVKVWTGTGWREGMPLALNVPCAEYGLIPAAVTNDGFTPVNARSLQQSRRGIARIADNGELVWHNGAMRQYGPWGMVSGYRVLDARMIPAQARPS